MMLVPCGMLALLASFAAATAAAGAARPERHVALFHAGATAAQKAAQLDVLNAALAAVGLQQEAGSSREAVRSFVFQGFHALGFPAAAIGALDSELFAHVEPNALFHAAAPQPPIASPTTTNATRRDCEAQEVPAALYNLDRLDQVNLPLDGLYVHPASVGADVTVFIVDTGMRITHEEFREAGGGGARATWGVNTIDDDDTDSTGHGTHVAGTAGGLTYGVCKTCGLVSVKVLGAGGTGTLESILEGLEWIGETGIPGSSEAAHFVINLSLGGALSEIFDTALAVLRDSPDTNAHIVAAAGNTNVDACGTSPARAGAAISVANSFILISQDFRTGGTNWGPCVTLWAPGNQILSAGSLSDTSSRTTGGTSMSAPHVSGVVALYASSMGPGAAVERVKQAVLADASEGLVGDALEDRGTPNLLLRMPCPLPTS